MVPLSQPEEGHPVVEAAEPKRRTEGDRSRDRTRRAAPRRGLWRREVRREVERWSGAPEVEQIPNAAHKNARVTAGAVEALMLVPDAQVEVTAARDLGHALTDEKGVDVGHQRVDRSRQLWPQMSGSV